MLHRKRWMMHEKWHKASGLQRVGMAVTFGTFGLACMTAVALVFGYAVQWLWNAILPDVANLRPISYWQAVGLLVLSRLLVGGFHRGGGGHHYRGHCHHKRHDEALDEFVEHGPHPAPKPTDAE